MAHLRPLSLDEIEDEWNDTMATEVEDHPRNVAARVLGGVGWEPGKHD